MRVCETTKFTVKLATVNLAAHAKTIGCCCSARPVVDVDVSNALVPYLPIAPPQMSVRLPWYLVFEAWSVVCFCVSFVFHMLRFCQGILLLSCTVGRGL